MTWWFRALVVAWWLWFVFAITVSVLVILTLIGARSASASPTGLASWYELAGNRMANGQTMRVGDSSVASRTLPFGTTCRFTWHGRSVTGVVRDRGPAASTGRLFDLERSLAQRLGFQSAGVALVNYQCKGGMMRKKHLRAENEYLSGELNRIREELAESQRLYAFVDGQLRGIRQYMPPPTTTVRLDASRGVPFG